MFHVPTSSAMITTMLGFCAGIFFLQWSTYPGQGCRPATMLASYADVLCSFCNDAGKQFEKSPNRLGNRAVTG